MSFKQFLINEKKTNYDYSSLIFEVPEKLTDNIISWGFDHVPDSAIFYDPKDISFGREDDIHITLIYGLHTNDPNELINLFRYEKPFKCQLGKISVFENNNKFDVLIIKVHCEELHRLNQKMRSNVEATENFPVYVPHVTICYLEKGQGEKFKHNKFFDKEEFLLNQICFSSKNGKKTIIKLGGK